MYYKVTSAAYAFIIELLLTHCYTIEIMHEGVTLMCASIHGVHLTSKHELHYSINSTQTTLTYAFTLYANATLTGCKHGEMSGHQSCESYIFAGSGIAKSAMYSAF